jgi:predicted Zn-dependent protease
MHMAGRVSTSFRVRILAGALAILQGAGAQAQLTLPDLGDSAQADFTPQMERKVGEQIMRQIRRDPDYISDPEIADYIQRIGQRIVAVTPEAKQDFEFFVVRDPMVNAFAMPGGYIGVHSGLITTANSESEVASVLSHEVAHVTQRHLARQLQKQNQVSLMSMAGVVLGLLAARSNPGAAGAAIVGAQALPAATFLAYSRDYEREADRIGFTYLQDSGYDVFGMPGFFERLQQSSRLYDNNAPAYLRTHPLTSDRIADMQNRVENMPVKQYPDSVDFLLVRAKLRGEQGRPDDAVAYYRDVVRERRFSNEWSARYGYAVALLRAKSYAEAAEEAGKARERGPRSPMLDHLVARVMAERGDLAGARAGFEKALAVYPDNAGLRFGYVDVLQRQGQQTEALAALDSLLRDRPRDPNVYLLQAKSQAALGRRFEQHRALGEAYALQGSLSAAIQQFEYAQTSGQGDFYGLSAVDARVRDLRRAQKVELEESKNKLF